MKLNQIKSLHEQDDPTKGPSALDKHIGLLFKKLGMKPQSVDIRTAGVSSVNFRASGFYLDQNDLMILSKDAYLKNIVVERGEVIFLFKSN